MVVCFEHVFETAFQAVSCVQQEAHKNTRNPRICKGNKRRFFRAFAWRFLTSCFEFEQKNPVQGRICIESPFIFVFFRTKFFLLFFQLLVSVEKCFSSQKILLGNLSSVLGSPFPKKNVCLGPFVCVQSTKNLARFILFLSAFFSFLNLDQVDNCIKFVQRGSFPVQGLFALRGSMARKCIFFAVSVSKNSFFSN